MAGVYIKSLESKWIQLEKNLYLSYDSIVGELKKFHGIQDDSISFKIYNGCREITAGSSFPWPQKDVFINTTISLSGGKGGFGSMLRAIGAQIEKTTNREACRDLSGRRLRDINEEKRLKDWVAKQAEREQEREERKQKKLEKLKRLESEFKHEFHDPEYFKARSEVTDKVHEALEQGIHAASSSTSDEPALKKLKPDDAPVLKKTGLWVGVSDDDSELDSDVEEKSKLTSDENSQSVTAKESNESQGSNESIAKEEVSADAVKSGPTPTSSQPFKDTDSRKKMDEPENSMIQQTKQTTPMERVETEKKLHQPAEPTVFEPIVLEDFNNPQELELLGLNHLKFELQSRGMKCGGTLSERASRLFSVKGIESDKIDPSLMAKPPKKK